MKKSVVNGGLIEAAKFALEALEAGGGGFIAENLRRELGKCAGVVCRACGRIKPHVKEQTCLHCALIQVRRNGG